MQETLNQILSEIKGVKSDIKELKEYVDTRFEEMKEYVDAKFEENNKKLIEYVDTRFEKNNNEIADELRNILDLIKRTIDKKYSDKEIKSDIKKLEEKLDRKIKEDKESFKASTARLNKIELTQEYFECKIDDLKKAERVAI